MKLNYKRTICVGFAFFLISAFWIAYDAIIPLILINHFGFDQLSSAGVMAMDNVFAVFLLPLFGALSDKVNTKHGKRTPFIIIGTILAVVFFVGLVFADNAQLNAVKNADVTVEDASSTKIEEIYDSYYGEREGYYKDLSTALKEKDDQKADSIREDIKEVDAKIEALDKETLKITKSNPTALVFFIILLMLVLLSMAVFRSPAVALMPDVTVKPLRSKGNAIINLMGTAGGVIILVLGMVLGTGSKNPYMNYTLYIIVVALVMVIGLVLFLTTVKEKKWAEEMEEETIRLGLGEEAPEEEKESGVKVIAEKKDGKMVKHGGLSKDQFKSLMLILASVALWYIGYNSITSKYSVYAVNELGVDYGLTLIVAQAAAIVSYIPVGMIASKLGRKKTILTGITMLAAAFIIGAFIGEGVNPLVMYPVFMLAGIGWATINVNSFPMVVELAKGGEVGKYTGYYYTASMAAQICAPILSGFLYDIFGMRYVFFPFGAIFVIGSFITMYFVKHGDSRPDAKSVVEDALAGGDD